MDTWSLPKARPIACNDCPAFQRPHMSIRWFAESIDLDLWLARIVRFTCTGHNELPFRTTRSGDRFWRPSPEKRRSRRSERDHHSVPQHFLQADLSGLGDNHRMYSLSKKKHSAVLDVVEQRHETEIHV